MAFWTQTGAMTGSGTGSASTSTLAPPTGVTASAPVGATSVTVTWAAPATGVAPAGYQVFRTDTATGTAVAGCGTSVTSPVTATSCVDGSVPDGTYRYAVLALRTGWTATSADSNPVTVQQSVATATALTSSGSPSLVGQSVTFTATVSAATGTPTGAVVFRNGGVAISCTGGSQTLSSGVATCVVAFGTSGTRSITAAYAASAPFTASTSPALSQVVNQQTQTISFTSTAPSGATVGGTTYSVAASASSALAVTFSSATPAVCTVSGSTVTFVGAGTCTVLADQAGNAAYAAAPQRSQSFAVVKAAQTLSFTSAAPTGATMGDAAFTVAATSSSGLAVTFSSATPSVCTVSASTVSYVAAGTCTVNADQAGNAGYNAAPRITQSFLVAAAPNAPSNLQVSGSATSATATWTSVAGYTYECQNTNGGSTPLPTGWTACSPGVVFTPKSGQQTFWVRGLRGSVVTDVASVAFKP
ncbi:Ig-like domain repeat protein [Terrabacter terrigena]|uniref:Ig-like domain repeat protein n=1 Tax=Terrabacter terrigena TaxID=574718 RepID=A0ABW3MUG1_9MICO